ncbi:MAG: beta-galactosidase [Patescibacteria group bacterium]
MTTTPSPRKPRHLLRRVHDHARELGLAGLVSLAMILGIFFVGVVRDNLELEHKEVAFGATFSKKYAEFLGLDWKTVYAALLEDLQVKKIRIPAYWDDIEPEPGVYSFSTVDWQIDQAERHGATVVLAIGRKLPRWPECYSPQWAKGLDESLLKTRILSMIEAVVKHYKKRAIITAWQVENEPFFAFGECPPPDRDFLKHEVAVVRALDFRPVIITESGELSTWLDAAGIADIVGISTYRTVWNRFVGYFYWPITPSAYQRRADQVNSLVDKIIITELQAEPWFGSSTASTSPLADQLKLMNPDRLAQNISFARRIGFSEVYLWGVEWWYWLKQNGHPEMWDAGRTFLRSINAIGGRPNAP